MTTALTIITAALQELGVAEAGQTLDSDDSQLCLDALNALADAWLVEPNFAYTNTLVSAALPAATQSRTIGASQQFNCARPVRLESPGCYVRVGTIDYPLEVVNEAQYNAIGLKSVDGPRPSVCWYDAGATTGTVYFWPTGACTVYLLVQTPVSQFATLATDVTLVPGYQRAFKYALMEDIAASFGRQLTALQVRHAAQAKRMVKRANFVVPQLEVGSPPQLPGEYAIRAG